MTQNPFPPTVKNKDGKDMPCQRHLDWQAGYSAGFAESLIMASKGLNEGMKKIGLRIPIVSDILERLK